MSITDELRNEARGFGKYVYASEQACHLTAIADRIDKEHEYEVTMARGEAVTKLGNKVANEYVALPKDADGEVIHIGDVMDTEHFGTVEVEGFMHHSVAFYNYSEQPAYLCTTPTSLCRHHREPTVEDVLREFYVLAVRGKEAHAEDVDKAVLAEYSAKLRLADGGEEQ